MNDVYSVHTLSVSPSSDDTVGTVGNGSSRNTSRLHVIIESQRRWQAYHSDVPVTSVWQVILVHYYRNACELLRITGTSPMFL